MALEEIAAELAKLPTDRIPARQDWARLSGAWTKRIDQRIAELQRLRAGQRNASDADAYPSTNANLQIQPIERGVGDPVRGIGLVKSERNVPGCP